MSPQLRISIRFYWPTRMVEDEQIGAGEEGAYAYITQSAEYITGKYLRQSGPPAALQITSLLNLLTFCSLELHYLNMVVIPPIDNIADSNVLRLSFV